MNADAEDPRVAAGTMTAGAATVPWVVWDEGSALSTNSNSVFVARLVSGQFQIANAGQPIGTGDRPDITFSGNTSYVTWHHDGHVVTGHFRTPDQFVTDGGAIGASVSDAVRAPISSLCIATPFNQDGAACQGGAVGTPFLLFTDGDASRAELFAQAFQPSAVSTGAPSNVKDTSATANGSVDPGGAPVNVHFDFGPTSAYGSSAPVQRLGPADGATAFSAAITGAPGHTIHYRAVAQTDFVTITGPDQSLRLEPNAQPHSRILGLKRRISSRRLQRFHGKASDSDGIARVDIGLLRLVGGARVSSAKCLALRRGGRFKSVKRRHGKCSRPTFVRAKGTTRWSFKLSTGLPRGTYVLFSRAVDRTGKKETSFSARRGNERGFRVT